MAAGDDLARLGASIGQAALGPAKQEFGLLKQQKEEEAAANDPYNMLRTIGGKLARETDPAQRSILMKQFKDTGLIIESRPGFLCVNSIA